MTHVKSSGQRRNWCVPETLVHTTASSTTQVFFQMKNSTTTEWWKSVGTWDFWLKIGVIYGLSLAQAGDSLNYNIWFIWFKANTGGLWLLMLFTKGGLLTVFKCTLSDWFIMWITRSQFLLDFYDFRCLYIQNTTGAITRLPSQPKEPPQVPSTIKAAVI